MEIGISLYPGLSGGPADVEKFLDLAKTLGYTRLFCSFHIPETHPEQFRQQMQTLLQQAAARHFFIIGDLVPGAAIPAALTHLRLDDGFTPDKVAALQKRYPEKILVLNASCITEAALIAYEIAGVDLSRVEALHNFYPHPHTGLSEAFLCRQNERFHAKGIRVGAFIPSQTGRRGPLFKGLPTLEKDRDKKAALAMKHLALLGTDVVYFGDGAPSEEELTQVAACGGEVLELTLRIPRFRPDIDDLLPQHVYEIRPDEAEEVIRTTNSRALWKNHAIPAMDYGRCHKGTVILDNEGYGRYKGELAICKTELPSDRNVNVLGQIPEEELFLLSYLHGGQKFRFRVVE